MKKEKRRKKEREKRDLRNLAFFKRFGPIRSGKEEALFLAAKERTCVCGGGGRSVKVFQNEYAEE